MSNPSSRIDELARRVLHYAKWPNLSSIVIKNDGSNSKSPTPYLDELERSLEITHHSSPLINNNTKNDSSGGVRTCTVPKGLTNNNNTNNNSNSNSDKGSNDVWTWTPQTDTVNNSYSKPSIITSSSPPNNNNNNNNNDDDNDGRTLEDMAPFKPEFYRSLGNLIREAYCPGSVKDDDNDDDESLNTLEVGIKAPPAAPYSGTKQTHVHNNDSSILVLYQGLY